MTIVSVGYWSHGEEQRECSCSSSTPFILAKAVADVAKEINDPESMWPHSPTKSTAARNGLAKF